jgi:hypothetical protein
MRAPALAILSEQSFGFWYSPLLKLEATLLATDHKGRIELDFYEEYFRVAECYGDLNRIFEIGSPDALKHGIPVMDALHIAAANLARCEVLVTTEGPTRSTFRTSLVRVAGILTPIR